VETLQPYTLVVARRTDVVCVRGLQRPAPHVKESFRHWSCEGDKTGRCASREKEMQITQTQSVEVLHSKPPGMLVETRWCIVLFINIFVFLII